MIVIKNLELSVELQEIHPVFFWVLVWLWTSVIGSRDHLNYVKTRVGCLGTEHWLAYFIFHTEKNSE